MDPDARMTRRVVMKLTGGSVRRIQIGVANMKRMIRPVSGGLVVGEGGAICVERKSMRSRNGSTRILQRVMNTRIVSTISSKLLLCSTVLLSVAAVAVPGAAAAVDDGGGAAVVFDDSDPALLALAADRSARCDVDKGEYRREYRPKINVATTTTGPAHRMTASP